MCTQITQANLETHISLGDSELYLNQFENNFESDPFWYFTSPATQSGGGDSQGGSNSGSGVSSTVIRTPYYDILIDVPEKRHYPGNIVEVVITAINVGDISDNDGILISSLIDPQGNEYSINQQVFKEISPSCRRGEYDSVIEKCRYLDIIESAYKYIRIDELILPDDAKIGEWKAKVVYQTVNQPSTESFVSFKVTKKTNNTIFIITGIVVIITGIAVYNVIRRGRINYEI